MGHPPPTNEGHPHAVGDQGGPVGHGGEKVVDPIGGGGDSSQPIGGTAIKPVGWDRTWYNIFDIYHIGYILHFIYITFDRYHSWYILHLMYVMVDKYHGWYASHLICIMVDTYYIWHTYITLIYDKFFRWDGTGLAGRLSNICSVTHRRGQFSQGATQIQIQAQAQIQNTHTAANDAHQNWSKLQNPLVLGEDHCLLHHLLLLPRHLLVNLSLHLRLGEILNTTILKMLCNDSLWILISNPQTLRPCPHCNQTLPYDIEGPKWQMYQGLIGDTPGVRFEDFKWFFSEFV